MAAECFTIFREASTDSADLFHIELLPVELAL
jgi:hypothetical protein